MAKPRVCKNCGSPTHYTYQCWKKRTPVKKRSTTRSKAIYGKSKPKVDKLSTKSKNERQKLVKKLDKIVSEIVRRSGSDASGRNYCYTCGRKFYWKDLDCGHYIKRRYLNTRWNVKNLNPQCQNCNRTLGGNYSVYTRNMKRDLGEDEVLKLWDKAYSKTKIQTIELKVMANHYQKILEEVRKDPKFLLEQEDSK